MKVLNLHAGIGGNRKLWEGPMMAELKSIIDQPTEGLLYDLNRDEGTILTLISDPKWVNDFACAQVIRELKRRIDEFATHEPEAPAPSDEKIEEWADKYASVPDNDEALNDGSHINILLWEGAVAGAKAMRDNLIK